MYILGKQGPLTNSTISRKPNEMNLLVASKGKSILDIGNGHLQNTHQINSIRFRFQFGTQKHRNEDVSITRKLLQ